MEPMSLPSKPAFGVLLLLATAPVWGALVYGVDPTLDQALLFICGGR
jgi:hypothetical protein